MFLPIEGSYVFFVVCYVLLFCHILFGMYGLVQA